MKPTMRQFNLLLLAVASIVLFLIFRRIDWPGLLHALSQVNGFWPILLLPYALTCYLWALSWRFLLPSRGGLPPMGRIFFLRLAGDSLNQLTPAASLGGEPFKALRLQSCGVSWQEAAASLVVHKAVTVLSLVLYIFLGLALIPVALPGIPRDLAWLSGLGTALLAVGGVILVVVQRRNPCRSLVRLLKRLRVCPACLAAKEGELGVLDQALATFYSERSSAALLALLFFFLGWAVHALEAYLIFRLLGHPVSFHTALCLDALSQLMSGLGFMIPASLGVQDGGNILLSLGFNLGATLGAGFSILRRFREAFWLLLGLLVVARER